MQIQMREKLELLVRMLLRMFQRTPLLHKKLVEFHLLISFFHLSIGWKTSLTRTSNLFINRRDFLNPAEPTLHISERPSLLSQCVLFVRSSMDCALVEHFWWAYLRANLLLGTLPLFSVSFSCFLSSQRLLLLIPSYYGSRPTSFFGK